MPDRFRNRLNGQSTRGTERQCESLTRAICSGACYTIRLSSSKPRTPESRTVSFSRYRLDRSKTGLEMFGTPGTFLQGRGVDHGERGARIGSGFSPARQRNVCLVEQDSKTRNHGFYSVQGDGPSVIAIVLDPRTQVRVMQDHRCAPRLSSEILTRCQFWLAQSDIL
ncbi:hypothetical protein LZ30DRAFT_387220 [Colletotrichum cereale]|nr:hypothetical protein LZ30DRAFT_387220 [Colletotrichum cereale]